MSRSLIYGQIAGGKANLVMNLGASEYFYNISGHFVKPDGIGNVEIAGATDVNIIGWATRGIEGICSTTEGTAGGDTVDVNLAKDAIYEIRAVGAAGAAQTEAQCKAAVGETRDIQMVSTYYQCCSLVAGAVGILLVVGYRYYGSAAGQQSALVMINWEKVVNTAI